MGSRTARRLAACAAAVVAALALTGCFQARHDVEVEADGSGEVHLHVELDKKAFAAVTQAFGRAFEGLGSQQPGATTTSLPIRPLDRELPGGGRVTVVDRPERAIVDVRFDFDDPAEYRSKMAEVGRALDPDGGGGADPSAAGSLEVRRDGDRVAVTLDVGASTGDAGQLDGLQDLLSAEARPSYEVALTMPGRILVTNGRADGRTARWDLVEDPVTGPLTATSEVGGSRLSAGVLALAGLLALAMVGLLVVVGLRTRRKALPVPTPAAGGLGSPWAPVPPPPGPPPGWYPDPGGGPQGRWWDGARWTEHLG